MTRNLLTVTGAAAGLVLLTLAAAEASAAELTATAAAGGDSVTVVRGPDDRLQQARTRREQVIRRLSPAFQIVP